MCKGSTRLNALTFINERIMSEARSLIHFANFDMALIGWQLNFSEPANFERFSNVMRASHHLNFERRM